MEAKTASESASAASHWRGEGAYGASECAQIRLLALQQRQLLLLGAHARGQPTAEVAQKATAHAPPVR